MIISILNNSLKERSAYIFNSQPKPRVLGSKHTNTTLLPYLNHKIKRFYLRITNCVEKYFYLIPIGNFHFIALDFNPGMKKLVQSLSSIGTKHISNHESAPIPNPRDRHCDPDPEYSGGRSNLNI